MVKLMTGIFALWLLLASAVVWGSPLDLSDWNPHDWKLGVNQSLGSWQHLKTYDSLAYQTNRTGPSAYLNNLSQINYQLNGTFKVCSTGAFGSVGFIFGYEDPSHFYLFDWKAFLYPGEQNLGFSIKRFSAPSSDDLDLSDFRSSTSTAHMEVLASYYNPYYRLSPFVPYSFFLDYNETSFSIKVTNSNTRAELWVTTFDNRSSSYGQFGFYSLGQEMAVFSGFTQTGGVTNPESENAPVPEPATIFFLSAGILSFAMLRRGFQRRH